MPAPLKIQSAHLRTLFLVAAIGLVGCAPKPEPETVLGSNPQTGTGTHILTLPSLGTELAVQMSEREKTWVSGIFIHDAPRENQLLWSTRTERTSRNNLGKQQVTYHQASYYLSEDMTEELRRILGLYFHISPNSDVQVDARLTLVQSGKANRVLLLGDTMDVSTKFSLRLTESRGSQTLSDKIFIGQNRERVGLVPDGTIFPNKAKAQELLEDAYRRLWKDLLKG